MAPPWALKKLKVQLRENEELAGKILEKHRSMMAEQQLSEHQGQALSAAYRGVCLADLPFPTPCDLSRIRGVGDWVVHVMEDSFPDSNTPGETGKKGKRKKTYVPEINSAAYIIVLTLYWEMTRRKDFTMKRKDFMMEHDLIDAAEANFLSLHGIGPNNSKSKHLINSCKDRYTGWSCMTTLINNKLVTKWSNPARYELTQKGIETACGFLARGPSNHHSEEVLSDSDSDEQYERSNPGPENFAERSGVPKSKAGKGPATNSLLSSRGVFGQQLFSAMVSAENSPLAMPHRLSNENFLDAYEVVLILDDRETLGVRNRRNVVNNIHSQFPVTVEVKRLPVGDALWIARRRGLDTDYVLDLIVERKNVKDLADSIRDNRYKDQKLRLKKCGLRKLIYLVEGDPNVDVPESVKTAGYADTEKKYGHLTLSIIDYYNTNFSAGADSSRLCMTYDEFVKRCSGLKKVSVSDVFALQLMQVPQVTEEAALAVTRLYPTVFSLAQAYSMLGSDRRAQEEMLMNKSNNLVKAGASKAIFKFVWAEG